ncbi:hypothetical protein P43SY_004255 [Pythium insidiosum]|uniref:Uncharacterized protein n=1 Tax=Pythium insidiosum TaxID=114742 RepID=A0AAD5M3E5_PYTIN|nr:hypothetical protein P43SY_004255 [Pythium insidiosum]
MRQRQRRPSSTASASSRLLSPSSSSSSSPSSSSSASSASSGSSAASSPAAHASPALSSSSSSRSSSSRVSPLASMPPSSDAVKRLRRKRPLALATERARSTASAAPLTATPRHDSTDKDTPHAPSPKPSAAPLTATPRHDSTDKDTPHAPSPKRGKIERRLVASTRASADGGRELAAASSHAGAGSGLSQQSAAMLFHQSCRLLEQQTLEYDVRAAELEEEICRVVDEREQYEAKTKFLLRQLEEMRGGGDNEEKTAANASADAALSQQAPPLDSLLPASITQQEAAVRETLRERRTAIASILRDLHGVEGLEKQVARLR